MVVAQLHPLRYLLPCLTGSGRFPGAASVHGNIPGFFL